MTDPTPPPAGSGQPPPSYSGPAYGGPPATGYGAGPRNGMGTAALVLGILALVTSITVIGGIVLGVLALIFGIIGRNRVKRAEATNGGAALAGAITGAVGLVIAIVLIIAGATFYSHHKNDINNLRDCLNHANTQQQRNHCDQEFSNSINGG